MAAIPDRKWFLFGEIAFLVAVLAYFGVLTGYPFWRFLIAFGAGFLALWLLLKVRPLGH